MSPLARLEISVSTAPRGETSTVTVLLADLKALVAFARTVQAIRTDEEMIRIALDELRAA